MTRVHKKCSYSELQVTSNFSFLRGASHPEELITCAAKLGHQAIALTDHNTLSGIVRAHLAKKELGQEHDIQFIVGCQIELTIDRDSDDRDSDEKIQLLAYPLSLRGYASLCTLLTQGRKYEKRRHEQEQFTTNDFLLELNDFLEIQRELALIIVPTRPHAPYNHLLNRYLYALDLATRTLRATLSKDVLLSIALTKLYSPFDRFYLTHISAYAHKNDIPLIVTNDVHYHIPQRRALQTF